MRPVNRAEADGVRGADDLAALMPPPAIHMVKPRLWWSRPLPPWTWRNFLANHMNCTAAVDFFTVPTATFRVLYGMVVMRHDRRRVVRFNVTEHPTSEWAAQQIREASGT